MTDKLLQAAKHLNEALQRVLNHADEYGSKDWQEAENHGLRALAEFNQAIAQAEQQDKRPQNCGTGYCSCIECPYKAEPIEREPVIPAFLRRPGSFGHE